MTEERLQRLEALCQQAEKEPWHTDSSPYNETSPFMVRTANGWVVAEGITHVMDAEFIAYARTALPEALAEVRRLKAEQVFVRTMLDQVEEGALTPTEFHARIAHATSQEIQSLYESLRGTIGELEQLGTHSEEVPS